MDDDIGHFSAELLHSSGEAPEVYLRLAQAIRAVLPDDAPSAPGPFESQVTELLPVVRSLFAAALNGQADAGTAAEIAFRLHRFWAATNVAEGRVWLDRLLTGTSESRWTAYVAYAAGYLS
jgi:hypothetical protein